jgi:hypothetical protein
MQECAWAAQKKHGVLVHSVLPLWHLHKFPAQYTALQLVSHLLTNERWQSINLADLQLLAQLYRQPDGPPTSVLHHPQVWFGLACRCACLRFGAMTHAWTVIPESKLAVGRGWTDIAGHVHSSVSRHGTVPNDGGTEDMVDQEQPSDCFRIDDDRSPVACRQA